MMASMDDAALAEIANTLYALPLDDFIPARAAAAKEAAGKDKPLAAAVRALPKPSVAAWAVNMLTLHEPAAVAGLAELGRRMQAAQSSLDAASLRELARERRTGLSAAVDTARTVARDHGRALSDAMAADVEETLRALTADEGAAAAVRSGRLLKTLSADGVSAADLAGAVAVPSVLPAPPPVSAPSPPVAGKGKEHRTTPEPASQPPRTRPRLEAVRQAPRTPSPSALEKAEAALTEARAEETKAAGLATELQEQADQSRERTAALQEEVAALRKRLKAAEEDLERSKRTVASTAAEAKQAARAADKAGRAAMLAQERVLRLGNTRD